MKSIPPPSPIRPEASILAAGVVREQRDIRTDNLVTERAVVEWDMLAPQHRAELESESGIAPEIIAEREYFTAATAAEVPSMFADYQLRRGIVTPIRDTTGRVATYQLKADEPRLNADGKPIKYDTAIGGRQCLDVPPRSRNYLGDPTVELWITEGAKKVDAGLSHGLRCIIGVLGVWGWRGTNVHGGKTALADWEDIALNGRHVVLAFDSDVMVKASVRGALERLSALLVQRGAKVHYLMLPDILGDGGGV